MKILKKMATVTVGLLFILGLATASHASGGLVDMLVKALGVTAEQAAGGAGALLKQAAGKMGAEDFAKIKAALPEVESLLQKAPSLEGGKSSLSGMASSLAGKASSGSSAKIKDAAGLVDSFKSLGLGSDMVGKFANVVLDYAQQKGGPAIMNLLKSALL